jgi:hypothetical protein
MGCCTSVDVETIVAEEDSLRNPLPPHADWAQSLAGDIGTDPYAICRDFPRMIVLHGANVLRDEAMAMREMMSMDLEQKNARVRDTLLYVTELCGERETYGEAILLAWKKEKALHGSADASPLLDAVLSGAKLLIKRDALTPEEAGEGEPPPRSPSRWAVQGLTAKVLEYVVQGVVFFPLQRLHHLLWFPWVSRLQDISWTVRIFVKPEFPGIIYVQHEQVVQNYVEDARRYCTPQFQVKWDLVLTLRATDGALEDSELLVEDVFVLSAAGGKGVLCCGGGGGAALLDRRRQRLEQRVMDVFGVDAKPTPRFLHSAPRGRRMR